MLQIVHVTAKATNAGSGQVVCTAASHLVQDGIKHTLISLAEAEDGSHVRLQKAGIALVEAPSKTQLTALLAQADIVRLEWWNNPQIVEFIHSDLPPMRLVVYLHNCADHYPGIITPELVEVVDFCIAGSRYTHNHGVLAALSEEQRREKTDTVLATADFTQLSDERKPHDGFVVSYIGNLDISKRPQNLLAMSSAARIPGVRFVVRAKGDPELLLKEVHSQSLEHCFDIAGLDDDVGSLLAQTDVSGYPLNYYSDGYSGEALYVQQAMYAGAVPVVFSRGGLQDLVIHEFSGLVVDDMPAYSAALEYLYEHPQERQRMSDNARSYARQMFGSERSAAKLRCIYNRMMKQPKREHHWPLPIGESISYAGTDGAELFIRTLGLGQEDNPFQISLSAADFDDVLVAEQAIAEMQSSYVLQEFSRHYPDDGYLQLWAGLNFSQRGEYSLASDAFHQASRAGLRHWRLWFYQARAAEQLGRINEAHKLCQKVLDLALNFHPAMVMLHRLNTQLRKPQQSRVVLFSYPRSGNTWLRYIIEVLTGRPSISPDNIINDRPICIRVGGLDVNREAQPSAIKYHRLSEIDENDADQPLIVVVRNYKECIVRNRYDLSEREFDFPQEHPVYLEPLRYYHNFKGSKLLIYYETLMQFPERIIADLASFLKLSEKVSDDFLNDYQAHFKHSLKGYPGSQTGGKKISCHAERLTAEQRLSWDQQLRAAEVEIFDNYLSHYCEQDIEKRYNQ
ncbi:hypothetical protein MNBD_GAMMA10-3149 [hydrothermal vent metagenome]|uniref:Glycosyl transferase family 1 domain-containing protein n=1 Tax=hydrothermal vent metagenome TaxID=652676 RepID=A0A3B0XY21_9ZZZZ